MRNTHPFGDTLSRLRARKHGLTQSRIAELAGYDPAVIARMCQGQRDLTGTQARERVIRVIQALDASDALYGVEDANALLLAAEMPPLFAGSDLEDALLKQLAGRRRADPHADVQPSAAPRHNLPAPLTSFVGREQEMAQINQLLVAPVPSKPGGRARIRTQARLITLTGPGGVGKTRLALETATTLRDAFPDGVWWVPLAAIRDAALVAPAILNALEINRKSEGAASNALTRHLAGRHLLLVLDNCEHLIDGCAELITHLMSYCANLRIVVTSREALQVPGEVTLRVPPLIAPHEVAEETLLEDGGAMDFDAVRLFVERAQAMRPDFALSPSNAAAVVHICERLDGIPLALELAAVLMQAMSVEEIASRIDRRFALLKGGYRAVTARHQTLVNAVDWSYALLTPAEQILLARLSVFAGSWRAEAAEAICAGASPAGDLRRDDVLPTLRQLVNKSLVVVDGAPAKPTQYRLLNTIREYASEKLGERSEQRMLNDLHLDYLLSEVDAAGAQLRTQAHLTGMSRLAGLQDEIRAALNHADQHALAESLLRLVAGMQLFWSLRNAREEATAWLNRALAAGAAATAAMRIAVVYAWVEILCYEDSPVLAQHAALVEADLANCRAARDQIGIAQALTVSGIHAHLVQKDVAQARSRFAEALAIFEQQNDWRGIGDARCAMAQVLREDPAALAIWLDSSIRVFEASGNSWHLVEALGHQAWAAGQVDMNNPRIVALWRRALAAAGISGEPRHLQGLLFELGYAEAAAGDQTQASDHFTKALELACELNEKFSVLYCVLQLTKSNPARAAGILNSYLQSRQQAGDKQGIAAAVYYLGLVAQDGEAHDYERARRLFEQSLTLWRELGVLTATHGSIVRVLIDLGQTHHFLGDDLCAQACQDEAIQLIHEAGDLHLLATAHLYRGYARLGLGALDEAASDFRSASEHAREFKDEDIYLALAGQGEVAWRQARTQQSAYLSGCASKHEDIVKATSHTWRAEFLRQLACARERLGDPELAAAFTAGRQRELDRNAAKRLLVEN